MKRKMIAGVLAVCLSLTTTACAQQSTKKLPNEQVDSMKTAGVGDVVIFGSYEQDNNKDNGKEPIEWNVISNADGKMLLMSGKNIDCKPFNNDYVDVTWESSTLREWLGSSFLNEAFSESDDSYLIEMELENLDFENSNGVKIKGGNATKDKVFLPSVQELESYQLPIDTMMSKNTDFAVSQGVYDDFGYGFYWLRSIGSDSQHVAIVNKGGKISKVGTNVDFAAFGIRPMICIDIS